MRNRKGNRRRKSYSKGRRRKGFTQGKRRQKFYTVSRGGIRL